MIIVSQIFSSGTSRIAVASAACSAAVSCWHSWAMVSPLLVQIDLKSVILIIYFLNFKFFGLF
jgi:hypothetical protein